MKIYIAKQNIHLEILNLARKQDPFLDVHIYSLNDLEKRVYPSFGSDALIYLMKEKHLSYEISNLYLSSMSHLDDDTNKELFALKNELKEKGLLIPPFDNSDLKDQEVTIVGYSKNNNQLNHLIDVLNLRTTYLDIKSDTYPHEVITFTRFEEEVYYVLNQIASLLAKGVNIKDIYILRRNNEYDYYLKKFAPSFGYQVNLKEDISYYSLGGFKEFKKFYLESKDINKSIEHLEEVMKDDDMLEDIKVRILDNIIPEVDFITQYDYLIGRFKEMKVSSKRFDKAVNVFNYPPYLENKYIFVLGFAQGHFPSKVKAHPLFNNKVLDSLNLLTSKNKIKEDEENIVSFLKSNNHIYLSFSYKSSKNDFYLSPISKLLDIKDKKVDLIDETFYSKEVLKYIYIDLKDNERIYNDKSKYLSVLSSLINLDYLSYDNSFKDGPHAFNESSKLSLSYSSLDTYNKCPFQYYLKYVVKLEDFETNYFACLGTLAHYMIEHRNDDNFDFDFEFAHQIEKMKEDYPFTSREIYLLKNNVKEEVRHAIEAIKLRESFYNKRTNEDSNVFIYTDAKFYQEKKLQVYLDKNTIVEGRIDSLTIFDDKYFVCIDYKTNKETFNANQFESIGKGAQLPTYLYLLTNSKEFNGLIPGGIYINNLLSNSTHDKKLDTLSIYSHLTLNGKTLNDADFIYAFDQSFAKGNDSFISKLGRKNEEFSGTTLVGKEVFDNYIDIAKNMFINMAKAIRENKFDISPLVVKEVDACEYCPYKDICYVRKEQYRCPVEESEESDSEVL